MRFLARQRARGHCSRDSRFQIPDSESRESTQRGRCLDFRFQIPDPESREGTQRWTLHTFQFPGYRFRVTAKQSGKLVGLVQFTPRISGFQISDFSIPDYRWNFLLAIAQCLVPDEAGNQRRGSPWPREEISSAKRALLTPQAVTRISRC